MRFRPLRTAAVLVAVGSLITGVGGAAASAAGGPGAKASGPPVVFGFVNLENSPLGSFPGLTAGLKAGVQYVNNDVGGLHGRPIDLRTCFVTGSPGSSIGCATQLLSQKPVAVFSGTDFFWVAALSAYTQAGVPILGGIATSYPEYQDTDAVRFYGGGLSGFPGLARYAGQVLHAKKVSVIYYPNLPGGSLILDNDIKPVLQKYGVTTVVGIPGNPASSDMTTPLAAANQNNPDAIIAIALPNQCVSAIQVHKTQAIQAKLMLVADCSDPTTLGTVGAAADGAFFGYQGLAAVSPSAQKDPDVKTFLKAMKKYSPNTLLDETAQNGFEEVWDTWQVLNAAPASTLDSPSAVLAAFKAVKNQHNFMGHPYTCDGNQVPGAPSVCDANSRIYMVKNGKLVDVLKTWENGSKDVTVPSGT